MTKHVLPGLLIAFALLGGALPRSAQSAPEQPCAQLWTEKSFIHRLVLVVDPDSSDMYRVMCEGHRNPVDTLFVGTGDLISWTQYLSETSAVELLFPESDKSDKVLFGFDGSNHELQVVLTYNQPSIFVVQKHANSTAAGVSHEYDVPGWRRRTGPVVVVKEP